MANELKHGSVGTELTQAEWEAVGTHVIDSQATGDIVYASSSSQLSRLGKGADNTVLHLASGIPAWSATLAGLTLTTPTISSTGFANANHAHAASNSGGTLTTVGALNAGSITSGFGTINNGSSTITTTGAITGGSLVADNITLDGNTISTDGDLLIALAGSSPTPDTDRLHIWEGSAGTVASNGVTQLTIEHSDDAGIQFLTPNDKVNYIIFGDADANNTGLLSYNHDGNIITMKAVSNLMALSVSGGVDLQSNAAGLVNVGASGNDWTATTLSHDGTGGTHLAGGFSTQRRDTSGTNTPAGVFRFENRTDGDMADGFGLHIQLKIGDAAATAQNCVELEAIRAGADNSGQFAVNVYDANTRNQGMILTKTGVLSVDLSGSGSAAQVDLFDEYDDATELQRFAYSGEGVEDLVPEITEEQRLANRERMVEMGIITPVPEAASGYHMQIQPLMRLLAGGIYQTRHRVDARYDELNKRLEAIGA